MKLFIAGFFVLTTFRLSTVWGVNCSPKYVPSGQIKRIDANGLSLNIIVEDPRYDNEKYFFILQLGWKCWDPDATNFNQGQKLFLTSKPKDILKGALSDSFLNAGYKVTNQTEGITLRFKLNKFLYNSDRWKYEKPFAEIALKVLVENNGQCFFTKEFDCHCDKPFDYFHQFESAEPVLSKCLSNIVEDAATDKNFKQEIFNAYGATAKVKENLKQPVETPSPTGESPRLPKNIVENKELLIKAGTCFLVSDKGFVCTNYHMVHGATNITVVFPIINKRFPANIEIQDISTDLVVLRLDGFDCNSLNICGIPYGIRSSSEVKLAEKAFTIGYPLGDTLGKSPKFTEGSISSLSGWHDNANLFQVSAPVQPGNSGGPLFDKDGNVIGIIVSALNAKTFFEHADIIPQNVNFAIKSDYLKILLSSISDCQDVKDRKGTLKGIDTQDQVEKLKVIVGQVFAQ